MPKFKIGDVVVSKNSGDIYVVVGCPTRFADAVWANNPEVIWMTPLVEDDDRDAVWDVESDYSLFDDTMSPATSSVECDSLEVDVLKAEIESLRHQLSAAHEARVSAQAAGVKLLDQLAEKDAEIAKLRLDSWQQLAASQLRNTQLRENVRVVCGPVMDAFTDGQRWNDYQELIDQPTDTSALEAMIAKAGEVMRELAAEKAIELGDYMSVGKHVAGAIRALPGVKLEDLK